MPKQTGGSAGSGTVWLRVGKYYLLFYNLWAMAFFLLMAVMAVRELPETPTGLEIFKWLDAVVEAFLYGFPVCVISLGLFSLMFLWFLRKQHNIRWSLSQLWHMYEILIPVWGFRKYVRKYSRGYPEQSRPTERSLMPSRSGRKQLLKSIGGILLDIWGFLWFPLQGFLWTAYFVEVQTVPGLFVRGASVLPMFIALLLSGLTMFGCLLLAERISSPKRRAVWFLLLFLTWPIAVPLFLFTKVRPVEW